MAETTIAWTDATWNPCVGCTKVSPGCAHCYAETMAKRLKAMALADIAAGRDPGRKRHYINVIDEKGRWNGHVATVPEALNDPLGWKKPRMIFVNSMSDLFHEDVPNAFIAMVFAVMETCHWHTFQVLTKRADRMRKLLSHDSFPMLVRKVGYDVLGGSVYRERGPHWRMNQWLGVSVERQQEADERIPLLLQTPAAVRFLSCEPLLGPVDLRGVPYTPPRNPHAEYPWENDYSDTLGADLRRHDGPGIDWVIIGGESGPGARPCNAEWIRELVRQCPSAAVPVFVKQLGANVVHECEDCTPEATGWPAVNGPMDWDTGSVRLHDPKGGDEAEWPAWARVRQFPKEMTR